MDSKSIAELSGVTLPFEGNGRTFGYPTANIHANTDLVDGVYFGYASLGEYSHHPALIFIGTPTTVGAKKYRIEAHLLDITDKDFYGETLRLDVRHFHRPNELFDSVEELLTVMRTDDSAARKWFKENKTHTSA
jgi:FAD synthase